MNSNIENCIDILADLVEFDVLGGQSNLEIIEYIIDIFNDNNVPYELVPNEDLTKASIHCRIGPDVDGGIILSGHTDVVPVAGQDWDTDPFELMVEDDKLFARGSCDMKGFLACCLASIEMFQSSKLKRPVYFAFSYDEEIGCLAGPSLVKAINDKYIEKPEFAIIGEPSMMQPIVGQKGICVLETTVFGSAGHSSRIKQEVSAIHVAAKLILWLEQKMDELIADGNIDNRFRPNHSSLHVGTIQAGIAPNVIADKCSFHWDVRVIPSDDIDTIVADFKEYCDVLVKELKTRFAGANIITVEHHPPVPPLSTEADSTVVDLIKLLTGTDKVDTVSYAAEAGQFSQGGFKTVICGPGDIAQAHRANEFIAIDQLDKCLDMLENLAVEFSK